MVHGLINNFISPKMVHSNAHLVDKIVWHSDLFTVQIPLCRVIVSDPQQGSLIAQKVRQVLFLPTGSRSI
jgi:hypothetical protein